MFSDEEVQEVEADDNADRERDGGPISDGMVLTALIATMHEGCEASQCVDYKSLTKIINSWLTPA